MGGRNQSAVIGRCSRVVCGLFKAVEKRAANSTIPRIVADGGRPRSRTAATVRSQGGSAPGAPDGAGLSATTFVVITTKVVALNPAPSGAPGADPPWLRTVAAVRDRGRPPSATILGIVEFAARFSTALNNPQTTREQRPITAD